jgi:hypothetical protein
MKPAFLSAIRFEETTGLLIKGIWERHMMEHEEDELRWRVEEGVRFYADFSRFMIFISSMTVIKKRGGSCWGRGEGETMRGGEGRRALGRCRNSSHPKTSQN